MIAERAFLPQWFAGSDITLDDDVRVGRHLEVAGFTLHQFDGFLAKVSRQEQFIEAVRQRCSGAEREYRVAPKKNRYRHAFTGFVIAPAMTRSHFLQLPMHSCCLRVINLHAVHTDVARVAIRVLRDDAGQSDEAAAIQRPAFLNRQIQECRWRRVERSRVTPIGSVGPRLDTNGLLVEPLDDFFAWTAAN